MHSIIGLAVLQYKFVLLQLIFVLFSEGISVIPRACSGSTKWRSLQWYLKLCWQPNFLSQRLPVKTCQSGQPLDVFNFWTC